MPPLRHKHPLKPIPPLKSWGEGWFLRKDGTNHTDIQEQNLYKKYKRKIVSIHEDPSHDWLGHACGPLLGIHFLKLEPPLFLKSFDPNLLWNVQEQPAEGLTAVPPNPFPFIWKEYKLLWEGYKVYGRTVCLGPKIPWVVFIHTGLKGDPPRHEGFWWSARMGLYCSVWMGLWT